MNKTLFFDTKNQLVEQFVSRISENTGMTQEVIAFLLAVVLIWSLTWKLLALWKSARKDSVIWFIVLALFNTLGILPIFYIFVFSKMDSSKFLKKIGIKKKSKRKK